MTTLAKIEANRKNGKLSTGPKTATGKAVVKLNAVAHGLRSLSPVLPGELAEDWEGHRAGIVAALVPVGTLEVELAERVALLMWRLRRVVRYETASTTAAIDGAVNRVRGENDDENPLSIGFPVRRTTRRTYAAVRTDLEAARANAASFAEMRDQFRRLSELRADHRIDGGEAFRILLEVSGYTPNGAEEYTDIEDDDFLDALGVPEEWRNESRLWDGWTAGSVQAGVALIAEHNQMTDDELLARAVRGADQTAKAEQQKAAQLEAELASVAEETAGAECVARGLAVLPSAKVTEKVIRYESHLNKQLTQTLHLMERLRAIRDGNPPAPPVALDVTVETGH